MRSISCQTCAVSVSNRTATIAWLEPASNSPNTSMRLRDQRSARAPPKSVISTCIVVCEPITSAICAEDPVSPSTPNAMAISAT